MVIQCKICKQLVTGPRAPYTIISKEERATYEFRQLNRPMAEHVHKYHAEVMPLVLSLIDGFALAVAAQFFTSSDPAAYDAHHETAKASSFVALAAVFKIGPAAPVDVNAPRIVKG